MTDIRVQLENELDSLQEENVESWIQRCFEACDPRYDSDWLSGMFELAHMQFPDHYEVRSACSKAIVLEARRLAGEGDSKEAVRRLEQLLEADPYCTEGFELLEELSAPPEAAAPPPPPEPISPPAVEQELPPEMPSAETAALNSMFADDEHLFELDTNEPTPQVEHQTSQAPPPSAPEPAPPEVAHHSAPPAPPSAAPSPEAWMGLWTLPRPEPPVLNDPHYFQVIVGASERMRLAGRPDYALRLLADHRSELQESPAWGEHVKAALLAWISNLISANEGPQAAQVGAWGARTLGDVEITQLAGALKARYGLPQLAGHDGNQAWKSRLLENPADEALLEEIWRHHENDLEGMLMLFRQMAVENPNDFHQLLNLGWAYLKAGTPVLTLVHAQRSLKLSPTRRGYQILAEAYQHLGQPQLQQAALKSLQETPAP